MGPEATRDLFGNIIAATPASCDQDHLRVFIDNNPQIPDRTANILGQGQDPVPAMVQSAQALARAGAEFIIIPCVSAHFFLGRIQRQSPLPILSLFEAVTDWIKAQGRMETVGLLATKGTIAGGAFAQALQAAGIETLVLGSRQQDQVMEAIYTIKADPTGRRRAECKEKLASAAEQLISRGAQGIIAGCTEIPLVLTPADISAPLLDPLLILAQAAVEHAVS
jgi:aspartate racemase